MNTILNQDKNKNQTGMIHLNKKEQKKSKSKKKDVNLLNNNIINNFNNNNRIKKRRHKSVYGNNWHRGWTPLYKRMPQQIRKLKYNKT